MRIRSAATAAVLSATTLLAAAPALAAPDHQAAPASSTLAANRRMNIPGLPLSASFPAGWPTFSPKSLYNSHTRHYPAGVRYLAGVEHQSPATFVANHKEVNLMGYGRSTQTSIPTFGVMDFGRRNVTRAMMIRLMRSQGSQTTGYSTVKTRFGTVYRVHYRDTHDGHTFNGVSSISHVNGHSVLVDVSARYGSQALPISTTVLKSLARR